MKPLNQPLQIALVLAASLAAVDIATSSAPLLGFAVDIPNTFVAGQPARADQVNENFEALGSSITVLESTLEQRTQLLNSAINEIPNSEHVIQVSEDGNVAESIAEGLALAAGATAESPKIVVVAPGVYLESSALTVPAFVELRGSGAAVTTLRIDVSGGSLSAGAALILENGSALTDITVENSAAQGASSAIAGANLDRSVRIDGVVARANGSGGTEHAGIAVSDSDVLIVDSVLEASGATGINAGFDCTDAGGGFSQPLLRDCDLTGLGNTAGMGMRLSLTAAKVEGCRIQGDARGVLAETNGITTLRDSRVQTLGNSAAYETSGAATVLSGGVFFVAGNPVGLASSFRYVHCIKSNFSPVVNGNGSSIE